MGKQPKKLAFTKESRHDWPWYKTHSPHQGLSLDLHKVQRLSLCSGGHARVSLPGDIDAAYLAWRNIVEEYQTDWPRQLEKHRQSVWQLCSHSSYSRSWCRQVSCSGSYQPYQHGRVFYKRSKTKLHINSQDASNWFCEVISMTARFLDTNTMKRFRHCPCLFSKVWSFHK